MAIVTPKAFGNLIDAINKGTTERRAQIQQALAFAAYYSIKDRNVDPALRLFAVVGRETGRQNMADWLSEYGAVGFRDGVPFFHEKKWKKANTMNALELEREIASAPGWWLKRSAGSDIKDTPLDYLELARAVLKKAETNAKRTEGKKAEKHRDFLEQLANLCNAYEYADK